MKKWKIREFILEIYGNDGIIYIYMNNYLLE